MGSDDFFHKKKKKITRDSNRKNKEMIDSMMIICEGQTESSYFKSFPINASVKILIEGVGKNTLTLLDDALTKWKYHFDKDEIYESIWIVMDRDDFPQDNYNACFMKLDSIENKLNNYLKRKRIRNTKIKLKIAYSNQAFELWYLLHFNYVDRAYDRSEFGKMLSQKLGKKYIKNDKNIYNDLILLGQESNHSKGQEFAIQNSVKLRNICSDKQYYNNNPSTSVDMLVTELNTHLKK